MHATATIALRHQSDNAKSARAGSFRWLPSWPGRSADRREATTPPCVDGGRFIAAGMQGAELRIDVQHEPEGIDTELDQLYRRLNSPGDALSGTAARPMGNTTCMRKTSDAAASPATRCSTAWSS
jgi:hypothetical protein